jgi:alpha-ribazole phosphatase
LSYQPAIREIELATELLLVRHAPSTPAGKLYGRTDASADTGCSATFAALRRQIGDVDACLCSPAKRCQQTAAALWSGQLRTQLDERLWEQDFGEWDGLPYGEVPDVGVMKPEELAKHRPPSGESFEDVCARVQPALLDAASEWHGKRVAMVAHAGVVRAAIALALGSPAAALSFEVRTLSLTHMRVLVGGAFSIGCTNWTPA